MSGELPPLSPRKQPLPPLASPASRESVLPPVTALPSPVKVKLDQVELPSGYRLDPEEFGIDTEYVPLTSGSSFAVDLEDDEPVHVVELPAELREFVTTGEAQAYTPEDVEAMLSKVLRDALPPAPVGQTVSLTREDVDEILREHLSQNRELVVEHRIVAAEEKKPDPFRKNLGAAAWFAVAGLFLLNRHWFFYALSFLLVCLVIFAVVKTVTGTLSSGIREIRERMPHKELPSPDKEV